MSSSNRLSTRYVVVDLPMTRGMRGVQISDAEPDEAFVDDCAPVELRFNEQAAGVLGEFLVEIHLGRAWLARESRGLAHLDSQPLARQSGKTVWLNEASNFHREPVNWYALDIEDDEAPDSATVQGAVELSVLTEDLARRLFQVIISGDLEVRPKGSPDAP